MTRLWNRRVAGAAVAVLAALGASRSGAEAIEAPLEWLYRPENVLVAATVAAGDDSHLRVTVDEVLHGEAERGSAVTLRAPAWAVAGAARGERYLLGYTALRSDPLRPGSWMSDPAGAQLLASLGLEPALLRDTPATRALIAAGASERRRESRATREALLAGLGSADPAVQNLAAAQLALEPEIAEHLDDAARQRIAALVGDRDAHPGARRLLLEAQARDSRHYGAGAEAAAQAIVAELPVAGCSDPADGRPALALSALRLLQQREVPLPALRRWTRGDCPALAELALLQLRRQDAAAERAAVDAALAQSLLPASMREFLRDHRRRLDLMTQGLPSKDAPVH